MLSGVNHITIAVKDLDKSIHFYVDLLGIDIKVRWAGGAYLELAGQWLCLSVDCTEPNNDYSHIAFDISKPDYQQFSQRLIDNNVVQWKVNKSEGDSLYFLDPDGYKLELHVGGLTSRIEVMRNQNDKQIIFYD